MKKFTFLILFLNFWWGQNLEAQSKGDPKLQRHRIACTDTDRGSDSSRAGKVTLLSESGAILKTFSDQCLSSGRLLENYCEKGLHKSQWISCQCQGNACVSLLKLEKQAEVYQPSFWKRLKNLFIKKKNL